MDVDYDLDVEDVNERWRELGGSDGWSQLIMKEPRAAVERIITAPRTGTYRLEPDRSMRFMRESHDWHKLEDPDECFFMRVYGAGDYRFKGADLGVLVAKDRMQTPVGLTDRARRYIEGIRALYVSEPLVGEAPVVARPAVK